MAGLARRLTACACALVAGFLTTAPGAHAAPGGTLAWEECGDVGALCATAQVPRDYDRPRGETLDLFVAKLPATDPDRRIGSLFVNFGGPGVPTAFIVENFGPFLFPSLNERFDLVAFDQRGAGRSEGAIDCAVDQQAQGVYSKPIPTPFTLDVPALLRKDAAYVARCVARNREILPYASTANAARDLDFLRDAVGDKRLSYLGFSYGTVIGATYATLFPGRARALALDGAIDAAQYFNRPMRYRASQAAALERALGRFLQACAADQVACAGFGGSDPWAAYDRLIEQADVTPIPADGYTPDPRPVSGDDLRLAAADMLTAKFVWGEFAHALTAAANDDGSEIRRIVDEYFYGRQPDGSYDPYLDRAFNLSAIEQRYRKGDIRTYLDAGERCWEQYDHFYHQCGYSELNYGLHPVRARDAFRGPFRNPGRAATPLVIATTYDPATPYRGGLRLVRDLGNARLLTARGDGHVAYGQSSACIDEAVDAYLIDLVLPPAGTVCEQTVPFEPFEPEEAAARGAAPRHGPLARRR